MRLALDEAALAAAHGDVPVGAVAVVDGQVVSRRATTSGSCGSTRPPTPRSWRSAMPPPPSAPGGSGDVTLVVTLEPCAMCAGALVAARVGRLVFGAVDPKAGACGSLYQLCADPRLNHELPVTGEVLADECGAMLEEFFADRR